MNRGASFTYRGLAFVTADGRSGFIAANDGSGTVPAKNVIIAGGTGQERSGDWLEFSPDDAIALAEGIIDAAEHAKSGGVGAGCCNPEDHRDIDLREEPGLARHSTIAKEPFPNPGSNEHCPSDGEVSVRYMFTREESGHIVKQVCLDSHCRLNPVQARRLAGVLTDQADTLDLLGGCK